VARVAALLILAVLPQCSPPTSNRNGSVVIIELPPGARAAEIRRVTDQAAAIIRAAPEVKQLFEDPPRPGFASLTITLKPARERARTSAEFERAYTPALQAIAGARVSFRTQSDEPGR